MSRRKRLKENIGLAPLSKMCENCPRYLYSFETVRETWIRDCQNKGRQYHERIKYYFKFSLNRHLKDIIFVIAYGVDHCARIFLDFKAHCFLKEKVEKAIELADQLSEVSPIMVSRKTPQIMRIFTSLKEFTLFAEQLRSKNRAIFRQRHVNGVYVLERISDVMSLKQPSFLAFSANISEYDPNQIRQIGCVVFSLESQDCEESYHYCHRSKADLHVVNNNNLQQTQDECTSSNESTKVLILKDFLLKLQKDISRVDFLVTHSMSSKGVQDFLRKQGVDAEVKETIDTLSIHSALFYESRKENSMEEILKQLEIPFESCQLQNAAYNAVYIAKMLRALLSQEFSICLSV